ncbi:MAG: phenylacetate--CoA ligase family protein [Vallitalea sp.]|jgi:phenylacetate-CoA ligase|nr:phenylacetate--CoA ligase family protein [Vallitalea sp.]
MDIVKPFIEKALYPIMEKRKGNKTRQNIKELINYQNMSQSDLHKLQENKLRKLLLESIKNVPAYQSYSDLKDEIEKNPFKALLKFPILDKNLFMENPNSYLNQTVSKENLIPNCSGGSTGEPIRFYVDRYTVDYYEAARWRGLNWYDISMGSRSVMIWGNPLELNKNQTKKYYLKEKWLKNRIIIPAYSLNPENMIEYVEKISKFRPEYLYGYSSALYVFAELMIQLELTLPFKPKAIVSTSETLFDFQRDMIKKAFGCPIVNEYGARDAGMLAYECPCGSMHICSENVILEVVDKKTLQPVPYGKTGIVIATDLNNFSMPRLRYKLDDSVILTKDKCKCNMGLPVIEEIRGREDDMFVTVDGNFVHGHAFNHIARNLKSLSKFQIIQHSPSFAELSIIFKETNKKELDFFVEEAKKLLPKTEIKVKVVDDIPVNASGKYRYTIRKFKI